MKKLIVIVLVIFSSVNLYAQSNVLDSLKSLLTKETTDTGRVKLLIRLGSEFGFGGKVDGAASIRYLQQALDLAEKINYTKGIISARVSLTYTLNNLSNYPQALDLALKNLRMANEAHDSDNIFWQTRAITWIYAHIGDKKSQLAYAKSLKALSDFGTFRDTAIMNRLRTISNTNLGEAYYNLKLFDSAIHYQSLAYKYALKIKDYEMLAVTGYSLGNTYATIGKSDSAFSFFRKVIENSIKTERLDYTGRARLQIADLFNKEWQQDSALFYSRQALEDIKNTYAGDVALGADSLLSHLYGARHQNDSAYKYLQSYVMLNDSLNNQAKITQTQNLSFHETLKQQQIAQAKTDAQQQYKNSLKIYILAAVILVFLIIAFLLLRNLRNKRKANEVLHQKNKEVERALSELKFTQTQLIQSEKMASLGELTAGIAHEIQNPLNFVNNFSEVNRELIDEMKDELAKGNGQLANEIADDIKENEEKINHHGQRAAAIVKGMLQHSRKSEGKKELTDINDLCDEYLRLSYHGLRAKDKSFNAKFETDFDAALPKINVVPHDIGRVILNLINNAFYAASQPSKGGLSDSERNKTPTVWVGTSKIPPFGGRGAGIEISVKDNGPGIPDAIKDKIFQPFFTTKPTGKGTGLGLSLSYDIIKAHGGEIKVESRENEGSEFVIQLPVV